ncbi:MAG: RNA polymerase sigma factor [Actinomycetota bacterium]
MATDVRDDFLRATLPSLDLVYNLARRAMRDRDLVEDLVQETYVRAFEAWAAGRKPKRVEPWMATICLNSARSYWRRASTRREIALDNVEAEPIVDDDVEAQAIALVRQRLVHAALWKLPDEQRIAVALMDIDGFTAREIAGITGAPRGTVLSRIHRGRKKLAQILSTEVERLET